MAFIKKTHNKQVKYNAQKARASYLSRNSMLLLKPVDTWNCLGQFI